MSDNQPEPTPPAEAGASNTVTNISGGVNIDAQGDVNVGGDVVGGNKITQFITNIFQGDTAQRDLRNRRNMLELVKTTWVEGVLEKSLYREVMLDLGLEVRPNEVQHPWDTTLQMPKRENRNLPPGTKIIQVFDEMSHALLILGEPGSGKTTMLLELARDTIARAEQDLTQPIPVVFNLSSWSAHPGQPIADWIVNELNDKYYINKTIARSWVDNDDLLLLLDGLDEVILGQRELCVKAINDFRSKYGQTQMAICSRNENYESLTTKLKIRSAILIQSLTAQQLDEYLERVGDDLVSLREAFRREADLKTLAQSPLMLSIMTLAYRKMPIIPVTNLPVEVTGNHQRLFEIYTQQMFNRIAATRKQFWPNGKTTHWLSRLAVKMAEHRQPNFLLDQMTPSWLKIRSRYVFYMIVWLQTTLLIWLAASQFCNQLFGNTRPFTPVFTTWTPIFITLAAAPVMMLIFGPNRVGTKEIKWSWTVNRKGVSVGLGFGLFLAFIVAPTTVVLAGFIEGLVTGLPAGLTFVADNLISISLLGLSLGLALGLFIGTREGVHTVEIKSRLYPNQGIRQWISNAALAGIVIGLEGALIGASIVSIAINFGAVLRDPMAGLPFVVDLMLKSGMIFGVFCGFIAALAYGGLHIISHYTLRFILCCNGDIPWNYVRFLNYAADLIFLRKVGGGYIFIHRMLMEYFAALETEPSAENSD